MTFWTNTKRIARSGFVNFWRNRVVSLAAVLIMTVTLSTMGLVIFMGALLDSTLEQIKNKVDINIYFSSNASLENINNLTETLKKLPEVATVTFTSKEEAIEKFRVRHKDDYLTIQALEELGENPLGASLGVKAKEAAQYASIAKFLEGNPFVSGSNAIVTKVNYYQNKDAIERLGKIVDGARKVGALVTAFLIIVSIVITFNTIRLAIYTAREEIAVMRLVGANNRYIRGPFVVEGIMYGVFAGIISLILFYPITLWLGQTTENFFGGLNLLSYYISHFGEIFLIMLGSGIILGAVASFLAVRKYLKI